MRLCELHYIIDDLADVKYADEDAMLRIGNRQPADEQDATSILSI